MQLVALNEGTLGVGPGVTTRQYLPFQPQPSERFVKLVRQLFSLFRHRSKIQYIHAGSILEVIECTLNNISREELYAGGPSGLIDTHSTLQSLTLLYNSKC